MSLGSFQCQRMHISNVSSAAWDNVVRIFRAFGIWVKVASPGKLKPVSLSSSGRIIIFSKEWKIHRILIFMAPAFIRRNLFLNVPLFIHRRRPFFPLKAINQDRHWHSKKTAEIKMTKGSFQQTKQESNKSAEFYFCSGCNDSGSTST